MEIIKLNLIPSGVNPTCHAKQYDKGRTIRFELFNGLTPYTLQSGDTVTLNLRKPDNTIIEASVTATQGNNYVDLVTTEQMCAVAGYNLGTFKIVNGETDIGTLDFIMEVGKDVLANGIPSQSVIEDLDALVAEAVGDDYYTKTEVDNLLAGKADTATTYTKTQVDNALALKANTSGVNSALALKADKTELTPIKENLADFVFDEEQTLTWTSGKYIQPNGSIGNSATFSISNVIDLTNAEFITFNMTKTATAYVAPLGFYKSDPLINNYLQGNKIGVANFTADVPLKIPNGANYCMLGIATADTSNFKAVIKKSAKTIQLDNLANKNRVGVVFGDSIIEGVGVLFTTGGVPDCDVVSNMKRQTGATIYNGGIGGTTMATGGNPSFCDIVDAIIGGDWSTIDAYIETLISGNIAFSGLRTTIGQIKTLDFNKVDYIILAYGTNDWGANKEMGDDTSTNKSEFIGALKYCISTLLTNYPHLQFYIVAPAYRYDTGNGPSDTHQGKTLKEYSAAIEQESALLSYPCLNLYTKGAVNEYNRGYVLSSDKVHRTLIGYEILARQLCELIRQ